MKLCLLLFASGLASLPIGPPSGGFLPRRRSEHWLDWGSRRQFGGVYQLRG